MDYVYKIKEYREKAGLTQEELAKKSGVSRTIISALEQGEAKTTKSTTLVSLADALEATVGEIFLQQ